MYIVESSGTGNGKDTAYTSCHGSLLGDVEAPQYPCRRGVTATTELDAVAELHHPDVVPVFLSEEGNGSHLLRLRDRYVPMLDPLVVCLDRLIDHPLHLSDLLLRHLLEVGKVVPQYTIAHEGALLLRCVPE